MSHMRRLPQASANAVGLGQATIMDRALAAQYGVAYVHLSVFAIDVDRVFMATEDEGDLPFGWEVMLCLAHILHTVDSAEESGRGLLEESCAHILAYPPGEAPLGSLLAFAVYAGARCGWLNSALLSAFTSWQPKAMKHLEVAVTAFLQDPEPAIKLCAQHCLRRQLSPPLAPPTFSMLEQMAQGPFLLAKSAVVESEPSP